MIDINVQKSLGDFQISAKIGLESDGVIALFGRSGSGKTSLVNMIAGLTTPDSGTISIAGKTLFDPRVLTFRLNREASVMFFKKIGFSPICLLLPTYRMACRKALRK